MSIVAIILKFNVFNHGNDKLCGYNFLKIERDKLLLKLEYIENGRNIQDLDSLIDNQVIFILF